MLCTDCARLEGVKTVVEGVLTKVVRRKDWLKRTPRPPIPLPETASREAILSLGNVLLRSTAQEPVPAQAADTPTPGCVHAATQPGAT